ncbi:Uncharacterised protein [Vibrio cholerae]|nr:Uncharacterised protein [Vibrio cholerae]
MCTKSLRFLSAKRCSCRLMAKVNTMITATVTIKITTTEKKVVSIFAFTAACIFSTS